MLTVNRLRCSRFLVCVLLLLIAGCKQTIEMRMDVNAVPAARSKQFFHNGFPTDLRRQEDGSISLIDIPHGQEYFTRLYADSIQQEAIGYSPVMPVYLPFSGALQLDLLSSNETDFASADAPIQLIDIDADSPEYGRRFPLQLSMTWQADSYRPSRLLQALPSPGVNLRTHTTYALIVTDAVPVSAEDRFRQHPQLQTLLDPDSNAADVSDRALAVFAPLRNFLATENIDAARIMGATVWTTGDPTAWLRRGAQHMTTLPVPAPENVVRAEDFPDYCVIRGTFAVPGFQRGTIPYPLVNYGGDIQWNEDGAPIQQYTREAKFVVTIPKHASMPDNGFPVMWFNHGAGGTADQVFTRGAHIDIGVRVEGGGPAMIAAQKGWVTASMAAHMSMDHLGVLNGGQGIWEYDLINPVAMRNNYAQMVWEKILFRYFIRQLRLDASLCPETDPGANRAEFFLDRDREVLMSQSLGNWVGTIQTAVEPEPYIGVIYSGFAASWLRFFTDNFVKAHAIETGMLALPPLEHFDQWHPFMMLVQWLAAAADPTLYAPDILRAPTKTAPHVLAISGQFDRSSSEWVQQVYATALGVDLAGPELGADNKTRILEYMQQFGARQLDYPVANNLEIPGQGMRTAVVVRHFNSGRAGNNGHNVTYDIDPPKHQYGCFLQQLADGRAPVIVEGSVQNGPCD